MESVSHSLGYELPEELHFDKNAQRILENSRVPNLAHTTTIALASSPSITLYDAEASSSHLTTTSEFLKKLGATFIHSIQLQSLPRTNTLDNPTAGADHSLNPPSASSVKDMSLEFGPHQLVMDGHNYNTAMDELQKQLDYDKFMNEVWIGVVLTLILISMIFCLCSCFLYHQFRMWKRSYRTTVTQSGDVDAIKINLDMDDPLPDYTLVSGLPSYESALELLHKNPQTCLLVHPSVFEVFKKNGKSANETTATGAASGATSALETTATIEVSMPLLGDSMHHSDNKSTLSTSNDATNPTTPALPYNHSLASLLSLATQITSQCKPKSAASSTSSSTETEKPFKA